MNDVTLRKARTVDPTEPDTHETQAYDKLSSALAETLGALPPSVDSRQTVSTIEWTMFPCELENGELVPVSESDRRHPLWQEIVATGSPVSPGGVALENHLALVMAAGENSPANILFKSNADLLRALESLLPSGKQVTPGELRLLKQMLCGASLSAAAHSDGVSHETKRSQYKTLAAKLRARSQTELTSRVLTNLLLSGAPPAVARDSVEGEAFIALVEAYIPGVRTFMLRAPGGERHRFVDIGPVSGTPAIMVHSQILSDFRAADVALLNAAGIRLIIPLRHGALSRSARSIGIEEHMTHACEGIDLARSHFAGSKADLLACISGCAYGIEYAHRHPDRVRSMAFLGACVRPHTGPGLAGRLRAGVFALARLSWSRSSRVLTFYARRIQRPATLWGFLRRHYAMCRPDMEVVETEITGGNRGERIRMYFAASIESIKHDFYHQAVPRWDRFPTGQFPTAFIHGSVDAIHPVADVRKLAGEYGGARVHVIPGAGQLLYHDHFEPAVTLYTDFLASSVAGDL